MSASPRSAVPPDEQQAELLERLRAAGGGPVSFEELRALGIENPAVLCYELELVGMPIARARGRGPFGRTVAVGVRIEEPAAPQTLEPSVPLSESIPSASPRWRGRALLAAIALIVAAVAAGTALALTDQSGGPRASARAARARAPRRGAPRVSARPIQRRASPVLGAAAHPLVLGAAAHPVPARAKARPPVTALSVHATGTGGSAAGGAEPAPAVRHPTSPAREHAPAALASSTAAQLQAEGHQLLGQARYAGAIGDLRAALAASGASTAGCALPSSEACLSYAYALYDLGRALLLSGDPRAAVVVLSERLRIDNQRATVLQELNLARAGADAGGAPAP